MKWHILHSDTNQIIKFEPIGNWLEHFLESSEIIHVELQIKNQEKGANNSKKKGNA